MIIDKDRIDCTDTLYHTVSFQCDSCKLSFVLGITGNAIYPYLSHVSCPVCPEYQNVPQIQIGDCEVVCHHQDFSDVRDLLLRGKKVAAIREYRTITGEGLREAKLAVEAMPEHDIGRAR